jgi:S1-C subfamily serine protease
MFWKKAGLVSIVLAALAIACYGQATTRQRARSANMQVALSSGYLGVGVQEITADRAKALSLKDTAGVEVTSVTESSPAAKAGLHVHDVILEVSGQKIENGPAFVDSIGGKPAGTKVNLMVWRAGTTLNIAAVLGSRPVEAFAMPPAPPMPPASPSSALTPISPEDLQAMIAGDAPRVGFEGEPITPQLAEFFGVSQGEGVLVRSIVAKTPAEKAGLKAGDVVIKVNGMPVASPREISGIVRQSKKVVFTVVRNKKEMTLNVEMAWNATADRDLVN